MDKESSNTTGIDKSMSNLMYCILNNSLQNIDSGCHGCSGKGWIENSKGELKVCPICKGEGELNKEKGCIERDKEKNNLPLCPWYLWPNRIDDPYWPTYPTITYCNIKTDGCTNCSNQK